MSLKVVHSRAEPVRSQAYPKDQNSIWAIPSYELRQHRLCRIEKVLLAHHHIIIEIQIQNLEQSKNTTKKYSMREYSMPRIHSEE